MRYKLLLPALLLFCALGTKAQQTPNYSQYLQNRFMLNPGATGVNEYVNGTVGYRKQWAGLGNEPTTFYAGADKGFIKEKPAEHDPLALRTSRNEEYKFEQKEGTKGKVKHGLGGFIVGDEYGAFNKLTINASYAAHFQLKDGLYLGLGANAGFNNMKFDESKALPSNPSADFTYLNFVTERSNLSMIDLNLGGYLYSEKFFVGYSTNQLIGDKIAFGNTTGNILELHHGVIAGYVLSVNEDIKITPSTYVKSASGEVSMDINARIDYKEQFFGGLSYRNDDMFAVMAGMIFNDMYMLSYSYDLNTSTLRNHSSGGHEIVLGIMLKKNGAPAATTTTN